MTRPANVKLITDILIIADCIAGNIHMDGASVFPLNRHEGFSEVAQMVEQNRLDVHQFKFIILLFGRADLKESDEDFKKGLSGCIAMLRVKNGKAMLVLTASLPAPGDNRSDIKIAAYRGGFLSRFAESDTLLEFS